ncbi:2290_t:CDS:2 [Gigaspora margarita]|uniref:2290_t:CDS:1 n=1 Tax=Gigaspora margarita TaxID=4874 RepID=A0ABN7VB70_GIGMA|nr:2290_t:CDS:2 [Gigaspora margarita]
MDSMCEYCIVARGGADIYPKLLPVDFEVPVWDHAPRYFLVKEAGGTASDIDNKPLDITLGRKLKANRGVVVANGKKKTKKRWIRQNYLINNALDCLLMVLIFF